MKKTYITPSLILEAIEDTSIICASPTGRLKITRRQEETIVNINDWSTVETSDDVEAD